MLVQPIWTDAFFSLEKRRRSELWRNLAAQDWLVGSYLLLLLAATIGGEGPRRTPALAYLSIDILLFVVPIGLVRGRVVSGVASAVLYRLGLLGGVVGSFSHLQYILPTARTVSADSALLAFDRLVFGFEPAIVLDRFVTPVTVEWFSFFYFGYFFVLAAHIFPSMFVVKDTRLLAELALGLLGVVCVGHLLYLVVPGFGPYQHLAGTFRHELDGPFWWRLVKTTVEAGDVRARTDIFPSLHTAAPVFLARFSFRHRRVGVFRLTWLPLALFASQIAISTMFLRWHYLVDVVAGLVLAFSAAEIAPRIVRWEEARRRRLGADPVFSPVAGMPTRSA